LEMSPCRSDPKDIQGKPNRTLFLEIADLFRRKVAGEMGVQHIIMGNDLARDLGFSG